MRKLAQSIVASAPPVPVALPEKKSASLSQLLDEQLDKPVPEGEKRYREAIVERLCNTAAFAQRPSQATEAASLIWDRCEGKAVQQVKVDRAMDSATMERVWMIAARILEPAELTAFVPFDRPTAQDRELPDVGNCTVLDAADCAVSVQQASQVIDHQAPKAPPTIGDSY